MRCRVQERGGRRAGCSTQDSTEGQALRPCEGRKQPPTQEQKAEGGARAGGEGGGAHTAALTRQESSCLFFKAPHVWRTILDPALENWLSVDLTLCVFPKFRKIT